SYTLGDFRISYYRMGPTELRLLLCAGNAALLWKPTAHLGGHVFYWRLFDFGGAIGIGGMLLILVISAARNTARLYRMEPLPTTSEKTKAQPRPAAAPE